VVSTRNSESQRRSHRSSFRPSGCQAPVAADDGNEPPIYLVSPTLKETVPSPSWVVCQISAGASAYLVKKILSGFGVTRSDSTVCHVQGVHSAIGQPSRHTTDADITVPAPHATCRLPDRQWPGIHLSRQALLDGVDNLQLSRALPVSFSRRLGLSNSRAFSRRRLNWMQPWSTGG